MMWNVSGVTEGYAMSMSPQGPGRMVVALAVLAGLALMVVLTMEPGRYRSLTFVLLALFGLRVVLGRLRSR